MDVVARASSNTFPKGEKSDGALMAGPQLCPKREPRNRSKMLNYYNMVFQVLL